MSSMNSLLLAIVILHSCHKISAIGNSDRCTNGFPDPDLVDTGEAKLVALPDSSLPAENKLSNFVQWIFPNIKFNCTRNINGWRMRVNISKQSEVMDRPIPQIATWRFRLQINRAKIDYYTRVSVTRETWSTVTVIGDSNVFEYRPTQPIPVQAGDIIGIMMPVNETERKRSVKPVFLESNASMFSCARVVSRSHVLINDRHCAGDFQTSSRHTPLLTAIIGVGATTVAPTPPANPLTYHYTTTMACTSTDPEQNISSSSTVIVPFPIPTSFPSLPTHSATTVAPTPPANPLTPQDRATTSTDPGLTTLPPDQSPESTSNQVISVVIGAVLAAVAVVIIAVLLAILVFIMNRRREDQKVLYDVPHIVTPRAQNLDNPIFTAEEKATKENWQLTEMKNNAAYISNTHNMLTEDSIAYYQQTMTQIPTEDCIAYGQIEDKIYEL